MTASGCDAARALIHDVLDGETLHPEQQRSLDEHLAGCTECQDADQDLRTLQAQLRGRVGAHALEHTLLGRVFRLGDFPHQLGRSEQGASRIDDRPAQSQADQSELERSAGVQMPAEPDQEASAGITLSHSAT